MMRMRQVRNVVAEIRKRRRALNDIKEMEFVLFLASFFNGALFILLFFFWRNPEERYIFWGISKWLFLAGIAMIVVRKLLFPIPKVTILGIKEEKIALEIRAGFKKSLIGVSPEEAEEIKKEVAKCYLL